MPLLDAAAVADLLRVAQLHGHCQDCGQRTAMDYCRSCDEFYWLHREGCMMFDRHYGHRLTLVPFVESR